MRVMHSNISVSSLLSHHHLFMSFYVSFRMKNYHFMIIYVILCFIYLFMSHKSVNILMEIG